MHQGLPGGTLLQGCQDVVLAEDVRLRKDNDWEDAPGYSHGPSPWGRRPTQVDRSQEIVTRLRKSPKLKTSEVYLVGSWPVGNVVKLDEIMDLWYNKTEVVTMRLEEAKAFYQEEWIAFRTFEESDNPEGEVVLHDKDRRAFDKELLQRGLIDVYITFVGPPVPEGYAVIF